LAHLSAEIGGGAGARPRGVPEGAIYVALIRCPRWYTAHDADEAGDKAASDSPAHAIRVRPPDPHKDWTDARKAGIDLRRWWTDRLDASEAPGPPEPDPSKVSPSGVVEPSAPSLPGTKAPAVLMPWPPRPAELANWPLAWRERWGRLANDLEAQGTPFPQSEAEAFRQVKGDSPRRNGSGAASTVWPA
jgi:hypothetical protein